MYRKNNDKAMKAVSYATLISLLIYIIIAFLSLYMFGSSI